MQVPVPAVPEGIFDRGPSSRPARWHPSPSRFWVPSPRVPHPLSWPAWRTSSTRPAIQQRDVRAASSRMPLPHRADESRAARRAPEPQSAEPRSNCGPARVNLREPAALWLLPVREPARRFGLVDYYRLAGWVAHLDQLADAPSEGIWFCPFVEQLAQAMCMPGDRPVAPARPHHVDAGDARGLLTRHQAESQQLTGRVMS